jgi:hypothetical protein
MLATLRLDEKTTRGAGAQTTGMFEKDFGVTFFHFLEDDDIVRVSLRSDC